MQGGVDVDLRVESAERTVALDFDGYAVGGLSVGETLAEMLPALDGRRWPTCPPTSPATSWGWVTPSACSRASPGVSTCSTACCRPGSGRHGTVLTDAGRLNLRNARFATDGGPARPGLPAARCAPATRAPTCATS